MALSKLVFLGTGSSSGVPSPLCLVGARAPPRHGARQGLAPYVRRGGGGNGNGDMGGCLVCLSCAGVDPRFAKNYRCNPSLLLLVEGDEREDASNANGEGVGTIAGPSRRVVQIDCCKTFRESMLRWYPEHGVDRLDAVVLTHEHADAMMGLDDVRLMQRTVKMQDYAKQAELVCPTTVWGSEHTMGTVSRAFPYLCPQGQEANAKSDVKRRVAQLEFRTMGAPIGGGARPFEPVPGLTMIPLPVWHGADYVCLGFLFGAPGCRVVYLSDISEMPPQTEALIHELCDQGIELLIVDALFYERPHNTHFNLPQTLECVRMLSPRRALCVGMTHDFDQDTVNEELRQWGEANGGLDVQLAHDGLALEGFDLNFGDVPHAVCSTARAGARMRRRCSRSAGYAAREGSPRLRIEARAR